ncbi:hypothetical protein KIW84_054096, partial [Lathyrus oleraceus]
CTRNIHITIACVFTSLSFSMELDIGVTHSDFTLDEYWFASDTSSGYLEDAITGWDIWCKQHNLPSKEDQLLEDHKKSSSSSQNHAVKHDSPQRSCCTSKESHENDASISSTQLFYSFNT